MAKFYRYMSLAEMSKLSWGLDIVGKKYFNARTDSEGVCFLSESTLVEDGEYSSDFSAIDCYRFLQGIVSPDMLVEFEAQVELEEACGVYANPFTSDWYDYISIKEYNLPIYNRDTMIPLRYTLGDASGKFTRKAIWYDF